MAATNRRFTIYDMMEARGIFEANPANATSPAYTGPVPYPKMLYHPKGEMRKTDPGMVEVTPFGPQQRGEKWELIWKIAGNAEEEAKLRAEGWHDHPAKAIASRNDGTPIPEISSAQHISDLERQLAETQRLLAEAQAAKAISEPRGKGRASPPSEL